MRSEQAVLAEGAVVSFPCSARDQGLKVKIQQICEVCYTCSVHFADRALHSEELGRGGPRTNETREHTGRQVADEAIEDSLQVEPNAYGRVCPEVLRDATYHKIFIRHLWLIKGVHGES